MSWWICRDGEGTTGASAGKINCQLVVFSPCHWIAAPQYNVKTQFHPQSDTKWPKGCPLIKFSLREGGRVATGEDTLPADSWPHDSSSSTFWEYEMVQNMVRIWNIMMLVATVTVLYSLAFYQLTVLSPTLHNAIQLGNYLARGAWRDDYPPYSQ